MLAIDSAALWVFTIEIGLKIWLYRSRFFRGGWNIFDFAIVAIAWLPATGPLSVLRALRIIRVLRVVSLIPQMRTEAVIAHDERELLLQRIDALTNEVRQVRSMIRRE